MDKTGTGTERESTALRIMAVVDKASGVTALLKVGHVHKLRSTPVGLTLTTGQAVIFRVQAPTTILTPNSIPVPPATPKALITRTGVAPQP